MRARVGRLAAGVGLSGLLLSPRVAAACAACFSGSARTRAAFFGATVFLSLLPLGCLGAGALWAWGHGREWLGEEFSERDAWTPPAAAPPTGPGGDGT